MITATDLIASRCGGGPEMETHGDQEELLQSLEQSVPEVADG